VSRLWPTWFVALALGVLAGPASAGDGRLVWKTVESEHFVITYHEPLADVANHVAQVAERSHRVLAPVLGHVPTEKTFVLLTDDTDGANGFANVIPRNTIRLFAAAPSGLSVLNDHDDWMYGLVAHEYTHVLHLDTIGGLPALVNQVIGKTWAPNQLQPRWVIEGVATYEESRVSAGGRTRSSLFDMFLRTAVLEGDELELDAVSAGPRAWPQGTAAYLYGAHFLKYVFDRYGEDNLAEMSQDYGASTVPYGINRSIKRSVGKGFTGLYDEWRQHMRRKYRLELDAIDRRGRREGHRLSFVGQRNVNPSYSPDGNHIVWLQADGYSRARLRRLPSGSNAGMVEDFAVLDRVGQFDVLDDRRLLVEQTWPHRTNYRFQDLVVFDVESGRRKRITRGQRARDPEASPDGRRVAFATGAKGTSWLAVAPLVPGGDVKVLWRGAPGDNVTAPSWSPDGQHIAFSAWRSGGYRDILVVDVDTGAVREVTRDRAIDADPVFDPTGDFLYFSSDRSGVYNIYAFDLDAGDLHQVTNVVGCALVPDVSPDGKRLVYQGFVSDGYEIYEMDLDRSRWLEPVPYVDDRPNPTVVARDEFPVSEPRDYRPLETLAPQSVEFSLVTDSFGSAVSVSTEGADMANQHRYSLAATVGLTRGDLNLGASYTFTRLWPAFRFAVSRSLGRRGGFVIADTNTRFTEVRYGATARMDLPVLRRPVASSNLSVDYDVDWFVNVDDELDGFDPSDPVPRRPETDVVAASVGFTWTFSDVQGFNFTVGPQLGNVLSGSLRVLHPNLGSDFNGITLNYRWEHFRQLRFLTDTSVLAVRLAGGLSSTDRRRSGVFVLGGVPAQDIASSIRDTIRTGFTGYLRGYEPRSISGRQFHLLNLEYRQQLWNVERGLGTIPLYLRRVHLAALFDLGNAFDGPLRVNELRPAVGGSLRIDTVFGFFAPGTFDIGYARGLGTDGTDEFWLLLTSTL